MSIRESRIGTARPSMPVRLAPGVPTRAIRPNRISLPADSTRETGVPATLDRPPSGPLSIFRAESSGLFSSSPSKRAALASALCRVEDIVERAMSRETDPGKTATLGLGRDLLADIGRRLMLLRSGAETGAEPL